MRKSKLIIVIGFIIIFLITIVLLYINFKPKVKEVDLSDYYNNIEGCFVLYDEDNNQYSTYNPDLANEQLSPFSTFKILNSLIGLETGVIKDANTTYPWDGKEYSIKEWNQDHTLQSAIKNSVVWYFQKLARNVGQDRMQEYIDKVGYGNGDISGGIDHFWLDSSLKLTAFEQVDFLKRFQNYKLPFSKENIDLVKGLILQDQNENYNLYGKTGSLEGTQAWFVGIVETQENNYYFATFIRGTKNINGKLAKEISNRIIRDLYVKEK